MAVAKEYFKCPCPLTLKVYRELENKKDKFSRDSFYDDDVGSGNDNSQSVANATTVLMTGEMGTATDGNGKEEDPDDTSLNEVLPLIAPRPNSARNKFLVEVIKQRLPPRPILIQKKEAQALNLGGRGMGNDLAGALACALSSMENCLELNLSDNNLSDKGIMCVVNAGVRHL